jgi:tetratricopeptide (TPR) repeat protein
MKFIIFLLSIVIAFEVSFAQSSRTTPTFTLFSDNNPNTPTEVLLILNKDSSYILMCCGGYSPQSAACVIKSKGKVKNSNLSGNLTTVNTEISSYKIETNTKHPLNAKYSNEILNITDVDVSELCGLNASFVNEYHKVTNEKTYHEILDIFSELMKGYAGNEDVFPILKNQMTLQTGSSADLTLKTDPEGDCFNPDINCSISKEHAKSLALFKSSKKTEAASSVMEFLHLNMIEFSTLTKESIAKLNDLCYFLEEGGKYREAANILREIVRLCPDRTVAYLNLADAYTGLQQNDKAKEYYLKYIELMKYNGKQKKIPQRVIDHCK